MTIRRQIPKIVLFYNIYLENPRYLTICPFVSNMTYRPQRVNVSFKAPIKI